MSIFHLPDLGEGITEAEIHEWHVKPGDVVTADQVLVSMETAKAVVDVPSPQAGKVIKIYGDVGDIVQSHSPLLEFESDEARASEPVTQATPAETHAPSQTTDSRAKIMPAVRQLAQQLKVDLTHITPTGANGQITADDVRQAAKSHGTDAFEPIRGVRRSMVQAMVKSHEEVVPVTLVDDADLHAWPENTDITLRLIRAITVACKAEPALNAWFDGAKLARKLQNEVNLGIAMDTPDGLFVPVIKQAEARSPQELRQEIDRFKTLVRTREIPPADLQGHTITLSNFGVFAGRYATPIVVPPTVAIIGAGKLHIDAVWHNGAFEPHRVLPLSISVDHRAVTGGEASRFLKAMIEDLVLSA